MDDNAQITEVAEAHRRRMGFPIHLAVFVVVNALLLAINLLKSPEHLWFAWPLLGWGLGLLLHAGLIHFLRNRPGGKQRGIAPELRSRERDKRRSHAK